jgi:alpha-L-fucosidase
MSWSKTPGLFYINLPKEAQDQDVSVIALKLDGPIQLWDLPSGAQSDSE